MGGFKSDALNSVFSDGVIKIIIAHLIKCSRQMKDDCVNHKIPLYNHEDKITNRLTAKYLNIGIGNFRYVPQCSEHFDEATDLYIGRTDIAVFSCDNFCDSQAYHIIECKRIDGSNELNNKYINEGVARFFSPTQNPRYSSYYKKNIMFGYVVKAIDIPSNTGRINEMQNQILENTIAGDFLLLCNDGSDYYVYGCQYRPDIGSIDLLHLFYDFSDVVRLQNA